MLIKPPINSLPNGFTFRRGRNEDSAKVVEIIHTALREHGLVPEPNGVDADVNDIEGNYADHFFGVLELDGEVVASFALAELNETTAEIRKMYALASVRGKGLGKWMVAYLLDIARSSGYTLVELETASSLRTAMHLYERMGFVEVQSENKTERCDKMYKLEL